jgi:hypothetical protein
MERLHEVSPFLPGPSAKALARLLGGEPERCEPTVEGLARLSCEPGLDFLILKHEIPGLVTASNGRVFIYECRQLRAALGLRERDGSPMASTTSAGLDRSQPSTTH